MEIFFTERVDGIYATFDQDESKHCIKVLRHKQGDVVLFVDGVGGFYTGEIFDILGKEVKVKILEKRQNYGERPYHLHVAAAPTKNNERYEWFVEKSTELGIDEISPLIGARSERKVYKCDRAERIVMSALKQSLKAFKPKVNAAIDVIDFFEKTDDESLKLIAYCGPAQKKPIVSLLREYKDYKENLNQKNNTSHKPKIVILIGPEGDFTPKEISYAVNKGFHVIHLGESRLRTETAALAAVSAVYFLYNE